MPQIKRYETGRSEGRLAAAQDQIRDNGEWAIIHDLRYGYELWIEGEKFGNFDSDSEEELLSELRQCIADPNYR